jgi:hypothetical protein
MLLRNRNSAIAIFSEVRNFKSATSSPQLEPLAGWPQDSPEDDDGGEDPHPKWETVQLCTYAKRKVYQ